MLDVPSEFWHSGLDSFYFKDSAGLKSISFKDFAKNRDNYEYIKEFNKMNKYAPHYCLLNSATGDFIQVNKGFVEGIIDQEDDTNNDFNKYHYLAEGE